jgi:hypothetical protein
MAKLIRVYWDSCAWIGLLNGEQAKMRELEIIYNHAKEGSFEIWTSTIALVEVNKLNGEKGKPKPLASENETVISSLLKQPFVKPIALDAVIAEKARTLFRSTPKLSNYRDAIHVASAQWWNIDLLHTYDNDDLLHLSDKLECRNGAKLKICYPDETTDGPLFAKKASA